MLRQARGRAAQAHTHMCHDAWRGAARRDDLTDEWLTAPRRCALQHVRIRAGLTSNESPSHMSFSSSGPRRGSLVSITCTGAHAHTRRRQHGMRHAPCAMHVHAHSGRRRQSGREGGIRACTRVLHEAAYVKIPWPQGPEPPASCCTDGRSYLGAKAIELAPVLGCAGLGASCRWAILQRAVDRTGRCNCINWTVSNDYHR